MTPSPCFTPLASLYYLLFDLDGTLTEPAPGITASFAYAVQSLGHAPPPLTELRRFIGPPLRDAFVELLGTDDPALVEEAVRLYRERYGSIGIFENALHAGVPNVLTQLRNEGFQLRIVTSKPKVYAERIIAHFGLSEFFAHVYGAELSGERSNKAELIAYALQSEAIQPRRACMIGDREHDIVGARANGTASLGVTWGYGTAAELEAAGADRVIRAVDELLAASRDFSGSRQAPAQLLKSP
ncbi:MAG TPA: HAD family hydrolase [Polyangiaceae bacterium]|nr:HAD family hydrolase [Polyangiaceae bacterium]